MKKLVSVAAVMLVILMGVVMVGCEEKYDFANDVIIVWLNEDASLLANTNGYIYTPEDFDESVFIDVKNTRFAPDTLFLVLTLKNPSHKEVLRLIDVLKDRPDVKYAGPSYRGEIQ